MRPRISRGLTKHSGCVWCGIRQVGRRCHGNCGLGILVCRCSVDGSHGLGVLVRGRSMGNLDRRRFGHFQGARDWNTYSTLYFVESRSQDLARPTAQRTSGRRNRHPVYMLLLLLMLVPHRSPRPPRDSLPTIINVRGERMSSPPHST